MLTAFYLILFLKLTCTVCHVLDVVKCFVAYYFLVWLRITDEGSVPEMRIWSILLIKSD